MASSTLDRLAKQYLGRSKATKAKPVKASRPVPSSRPSVSDPTNRPLAAHGLTSYRYRGEYNWIMIGALDNEDALREAQRSTSQKVELGKLQVWNGKQYVPASSWIAPKPTRAKVQSRPSPSAGSQAPVATRHRIVPGFVWTTLDGTEVLAKHHSPRGNVNYVGVQDKNGFYSVVRLEPRAVVRRNLRVGEIGEVINEEITKELMRRESQAAYEMSEADKAKARWRDWENQPGFYILPGDGSGSYSDPDDNQYATTGPYGLFEKAGFTRKTPGYDNLEDSGIDVEDDAMATMDRAPDAQVSIIYASNPRDAVEGKGHVWWQDGIFIGPPVDPRQRHFNF